MKALERSKVWYNITMVNEMEFGAFFRQLRIDSGLSLGKFSKAVQYDVSNLSKIERGLIPPPPSNIQLRLWLRELGIDKNNDNYLKFLTLASLTRAEFPDGVAKKDILQFLPAFYRAMGNKYEDKEKYRKLIKLLEKS